jgi:hypothetical protein
VNIEVTPADTALEAARIHLEIIRRLSPERRLELAIGMSDFLREVTEAGVRARHPDYSDQQVQVAVARLMLGDALFQKVHPGTRIAV